MIWPAIIVEERRYAPTMYTILIADDEAAIRDGLSRYIAWKDLGYEVCGLCADGQQVMRVLQEKQVDVLLCDIRMPGLTGLDIARYVYEQKLPTTVVLLSAYRDFEYARTAMEWGVRHYVVKSTRFADLVQTFDHLRQELDALRSQAPAVSDDPLIAQALDYMSAHLDSATLENVAARLSRSPAYLSRYFKEHAPEGFGEALTRLRMDHAARLLCDVRIKTYEVSERVGYASPKSFTRTFLRFFGMTPRDYRNIHLKGEDVSS